MASLIPVALFGVGGYVMYKVFTMSHGSSQVPEMPKYSHYGDPKDLAPSFLHGKTVYIRQLKEAPKIYELVVDRTVYFVAKDFIKNTQKSGDVTIVNIDDPPK